MKQVNAEADKQSSKPSSSVETASIITSSPTHHRLNQSKSNLRSIQFNLFFFTSIIFLHTTQLLVFPFVIFFDLTFIHNLRLHFNCLARKTFAAILILVTQIFAPTELVLTSDDSIDLIKAVKRDQNGNIISIDLPSHSIIMANHQIYADWLYIWSLAYLAGLHNALIIILKASLKWVPIVGPAMQMFSFIFLNRSWATDKEDLTKQLNKLANQTYNPNIESLNKIALLIFPEGTLVSPLTRPLSKKYADKCGIDDARNCLLPRATGSLFCMRALSREIPNLKLIDLTIGYPGIPPEGYGQDYYTLQSIFGHGHPPPKVHIHIKIIPISEIPIGHIDPSSSASTTTNKNETNINQQQKEEKKVILNDPTHEEIEEFDYWLRNLWKIKDASLTEFYKFGKFNNSSSTATIAFESKMKLKTLSEFFLIILLALPGFSIFFFAFKLLFFSNLSKFYSTFFSF